MYLLVEFPVLYNLVLLVSAKISVYLFIFYTLASAILTACIEDLSTSTIPALFQKDLTIAEGESPLNYTNAVTIKVVPAPTGALAKVKVYLPELVAQVITTPYH